MTKTKSRLSMMSVGLVVFALIVNTVFCQAGPVPVSYTHVNGPYGNPDTGNVEMTDGIYGTSFTDAAWTSWHASIGLPLIVFDFGSSPTITDLSIFSLNYPGAGIGPIGSFSVSFSDDNSNWSSPVSFSTTSAEQAGNGVLTTIIRHAPGTGRYVKLSVDTMVGSGPYVYIDEVTFVNAAATPTFSPDAGNYDGPQSVTISCSTDGADIYYTTDGTEPTQGGGTSIHYTGAAITVNRTTPFKAKAWKAGLDPSFIASSTYGIFAPVSYTHLHSPYNGPDTGNVEMTDGLYGAVYTDAAWTAWHRDVGGLPLIVFDFGATKTFTTLYLYGLNYPGAGISPIKTFSVSFSDDNSTWSTPVSFTTTAAEQAGNPGLTTIMRDLSGSGRYLKLSVDDIVYPSAPYVALDEVSFAPTATTPTFSPVEGNYDGPQSVTISSTAGADIYYTTDGSDPTQGSGTSIHYTGAVPVNLTTTLKAKAWKTGLVPSAIASATYRIFAPVSYTHLHGPYGFPDTGNVEMTDGIYGTTNYNDAAWTSWHQDIGLPLIDFDFGASKTFASISIYGLNYPGIGVGPIGSFSVSFSDDNSTWSTPVSFTTTSGEQAGNPGLTTITRNLSGSGRYLKLSVDSIVGYPSTPYVMIDEVTFVPTVASPTFTPYSGNFAGSQTVTISSTTSGATIRYTTDGSDPTETSDNYSGPITVDHTMAFPFKAKAWKSGYITSSVAVSGLYVFPRPQNIPAGIATVDGDLSEWAGAVWAPIDQTYYGSPIDVPEAYYTARWNVNKVYVAVRVRDTGHDFSNVYSYSTCDMLEIYLHTTGTGPVETNSTTQADAQQYEVGITYSNTNAVWKTIRGGQTIPSQAGFSAAGREVDPGAGWIYYEAALTPFEHFDLSGVNMTPSPLSAGQVIGLDVVVSTANTFGMMAENLLQWKSADYTTIGVHRLAAYTAADLAAMLTAMDSTSSGGGNWNPAMDLDGDGEITSTDLSILLGNM